MGSSPRRGRLPAPEDGPRTSRARQRIDRLGRCTVPPKIMGKLTTDTFKRPDDLRDSSDPRVLYARSYLLNRLVIGAIGVLLPTLLFIVDWLYLRGAVTVRGSLSAYYHTSARDLFVAALCITGVMLLTYMAAQKSTWDFWLSSIAGVAVIGVALLPTKRPGGARPLCGPDALPVPPGCTQLQQAFGETSVATFHYVFAGIFIVSLAAICFLFAKRERVHGGRNGRARLHLVCGVTILVAVAWVVLGLFVNLEIFSFTSLYVGEVVSVYAFGLSWFVKGLDLLKGLLDRLR